MFETLKKKFFIEEKNYTFDEYKSNQYRLLNVTLFIFLFSLIVPFLVFPLMLRNVLSVVITCLVAILINLCMYDSLKRNLTYKYIEKAEKEWRMKNRVEILPLFKESTIYEKKYNLLYYEEKNRVRFDVMINKNEVEFYIPLCGGKHKKRTFSLDNVYFDTNSDEHSFFVSEVYTFVDDRFHSINKPFVERSRYIIQSKYIQWWS